MRVQRVTVPVANLYSTPENGLVSQLLFGEPFTVTKAENGFSFGKTGCGYPGWVSSTMLADMPEPTHRVDAMGTFIYSAPDMKAATVMRLPFGAEVLVRGGEGGFSRIDQGYIYTSHLTTELTDDFVSVAERFLAVPYLWGGRSSNGLDCSALVQLSLRAAGLAVPRDSHMQEAETGTKIGAGETPRRGELVFWKGHVGIMRDSEILLHANSYHMCVASEPLVEAQKRIMASGEGPITAIKRP